MVIVKENTFLEDESSVRFFFNTRNYIESKKPDQFYLFQKENSFCYLFKKEDTLYSPLQATFGGIEYDSLKNLDAILTKITSFRVENNINEIFIGMPPSYLSLFPEEEQALVLKHTFKQEVIDKNYHINIEERGFEDNLHHSEKRRLKKCLDNGFVFSEWTNPDLNKVYDFIKKCRERKSFPMTMSEGDFKAMFSLFSSHYKVFVVKKDVNIAALGVTTSLSKDVFYHFYPADNEKYSSYSPSVLLHKGLYDYCKSNNYKTLDLGIASDKGIDNEGLIRFKENLGAIESTKITWKWEANNE
ncbi:MAG: GNAT family N-acetyltransferase [Cyclobacteriaceae bacterium]